MLKIGMKDVFEKSDFMWHSFFLLCRYVAGRRLWISERDCYGNVLTMLKRGMLLYIAKGFDISKYDIFFKCTIILF